MTDRESAGDTPAAGPRPAGAAGGRAGPPTAARPGRTPLLVAVALCPLVMAGLLVEQVWGARVRAVDGAAAGRLHAPPGSGVAAALEVVTYVFHPWVFRAAVAAVAVALALAGAWRAAAWAAATMAAAGLLTGGLKILVQRARPDPPEPAPEAVGWAFPSGHAMTAAAGCGVLILLVLPVLPGRRRALVWVSGCAVTVASGVSRIVLGVHWLSDVLAGWALGTVLVALAALSPWWWPRERGDDGTAVPERSPPPTPERTRDPPDRRPL